MVSSGEVADERRGEGKRREEKQGNELEERRNTGDEKRREFEMGKWNERRMRRKETTKTNKVKGGQKDGREKRGLRRE